MRISHPFTIDVFAENRRLLAKAPTKPLGHEKDIQNIILVVAIYRFDGGCLAFPFDSQRRAGMAHFQYAHV